MIKIYLQNFEMSMVKIQLYLFNIPFLNVILPMYYYNCIYIKCILLIFMRKIYVGNIAKSHLVIDNSHLLIAQAKCDHGLPWSAWYLTADHELLWST